MLIRRVLPCLQPSGRGVVGNLPWYARRYTASSIPQELSRPIAPRATPLTSLRQDLDRLAPRIDLNASDIEIIDSPKEFYSTLKTRILAARRRIYLSTLYVGKSEDELVSTIRHSLNSNKSLQVSILTDALRGTREAPQPSCGSLLAPLVREFPARVEIRMYHTPNLTGLRKSLIPKRINEGWGLQHMKLYGFDDEVILSGANLSNDYFTNRQDRYHLFKSKPLADYFAQIHNAVSSISSCLQPSSNPGGFFLQWPSTNTICRPLEAPKTYISTATKLLKPLATGASTLTSPPTTNTSVYPLLVYPPTLNTELPTLTTLLSATRPIKSYTFTAGYFNPHPLVTSILLSLSSPPASVPGTILTASPFANGFFGSQGISGMLPAAYSHLSLRFLQAARGKMVRLREWQRGVVGELGGWTYHAKGLWVTMLGQSRDSNEVGNGEANEGEELAMAGPSVTLIGSSNYTTRSYGLDLEVGAMVVTSDETLQKKWKREEEMLGEYTNPVTEEDLCTIDRKATWKVRVAMWIVQKVGGAL
ncbi:uncharacterized protein KY384_003797 [Bacidia gigantensis]|uniref:uncharacterized protein n=1 Tax=Bacidia gigantensis TaxID=2732470 RepID=UPI001D03B441|nr:uncharacterized protein KY384_003797 [Bacidia gigantensis]KAG8532157.1 hypothetical protein KY384_003797 [Bacidia gigantensis]